MKNDQRLADLDQRKNDQRLADLEKNRFENFHSIQIQKQISAHKRKFLQRIK